MNALQSLPVGCSVGWTLTGYGSQEIWVDMDGLIKTVQIDPDLGQREWTELKRKSMTAVELIEAAKFVESFCDTAFEMEGDFRTDCGSLTGYPAITVTIAMDDYGFLNVKASTECMIATAHVAPYMPGNFARKYREEKLTWTVKYRAVTIDTGKNPSLPDGITVVRFTETLKKAMKALNGIYEVDCEFRHEHYWKEWDSRQKAAEKQAVELDRAELTDYVESDEFPADVNLDEVIAEGLEVDVEF